MMDGRILEFRMNVEGLCAECKMDGYARLTVGGVFHQWRPSANDFYLAQSCNRGSLLPRHGARLKQRAELPKDAEVCKWCDAKES